MPRSEWSDAGAFRIAIPPIDVAQEFNGFVRKTYALIRHSTHERRALRDLRNALLPGLVSGRMKVREPMDTEGESESVRDWIGVGTP